MQKIFFFLVLIIPLFLIAKIEPAILDTLSWDEAKTLQQLSLEIQIPVKKMKQCLDINMKADNQTTLSELNLDKSDIKKGIERYNKQRFAYYRSIVLLGMAIVFSSLLITALIISLLQHVTLDKKPKQKKTSYKQSYETMQVNSNAVVAAITTVYMHELEVEQQNNMMLTWKRAPLSLWKVSRILPNQEFYKTIKRK